MEILSKLTLLSLIPLSSPLFAGDEEKRIETIEEGTIKLLTPMVQQRGGDVEGDTIEALIDGMNQENIAIALFVLNAMKEKHITGELPPTFRKWRLIHLNFLKQRIVKILN